MKFPNESNFGMEVDNQPAPLLEAKSTESLLEQVVTVKNKVIGNKRQKITLINQGIIARLLSLLNDNTQSDDVRIEAVIVLGSLAKGEAEHVETILTSGAIETLITGLGHDNNKYIELCLCCLRSLVVSPVCPKEFIYADPCIVTHLLSLIHLSVNAQCCVATILAECCRKEQHQNYLHSKNIVEVMLPALCCNIMKCEMAVLKLFSCICCQNPIVSSQMLSSVYDGVTFGEILGKHLNRDKPLPNRILAAKCFVNMHRAGALPADDPVLLLRVLPTLVSCCKPGHTLSERVEGAELIAYLTEVDINLQSQASLTDHCIQVLSTYFKEATSSTQAKIEKQEILHRAGLQAYASLAANAEEIRKKIIETGKVMEHITTALSSPSDGLQLAAVKCLHSLSRSVAQLRTNFQDYAIWKPVMNILQQKSCKEELMNAATAILCNLLLEFSPSKKVLIEKGAVDLLIALTRTPTLTLRVNAVWGLMNATFKAEKSLKADILKKLGTDQLFCLLRDHCVDVVIKTLGFLRNLLSNKPHIDHIMAESGDQVIQAVVMILESNHGVKVKEQTLCVLANVTGGENSKEFIMNNEDILKKILSYMRHSSSELQLAALKCISSLVSRKETGFDERQQKLKAMGVDKTLNKLLSSPDHKIQELTQSTLQDFS